MRAIVLLLLAGCGDPAKPGDPASETGDPTADATAGACRIVDKQCDFDVDGTIDSDWTFTYSADGLLLETDIDDTNVEPAIHDVETYAYDAAGFLAQLDLVFADADGEIHTQSTTWYTNDAEGNVLHEEYDFGRDGSLDRIVDRTWHPGGVLATEQQVGPADGLVFHSVAYDPAGRLLVEESYSWGELYEREVYTYDAEGNLLTDATDTDGDGDDDELVTWEYTYDAEGHWITSVERIGLAHEEAGTTQEATRDAAGNIARIRMDYGSDGTANHCYEYTWDAADRMLSETSDDFCSDDPAFDGTAWYTQIWEYDAAGHMTGYVQLDDEQNPTGMYWEYDEHGNLVWYAADRNGDGVMDDDECTMTYTCD